MCIYKVFNVVRRLENTTIYKQITVTQINCNKMFAGKQVVY